MLPSGKGPDVCLLGLDFLKAYKGVIDVSRDVLTLEIDGQKVETRLYERQVGTASTVECSTQIL